MRKVEQSEELDNYCKSLFVNKFNVTCWQPDPKDELKKIKYIVKLLKIDSLKGEFVFKSRHNKLMKFNDGELFLFCDKVQIIFKSPILNIQGSEIVVKKPESITVLNDNAIKHVESTEDQIAEAGSTGKVKFAEKDYIKVSSKSEEEKFEHLRAAPRKQTNKEQRVTVRFLTKKYEDKDMQLFDLSRGGAGIVFKNVEYLAQGDFIELIEVDGKKLNPALKGQVMSVKTYDLDSGLLKAGIKFG